MHIILSIILCLLIGFVFWFIGHIIRKELKINEDSELLALLINIGLGASSFLIVFNLLAMLCKSFIIGLLISTVLAIGIISWQFKELDTVCAKLVEQIKKNYLIQIIKQKTDVYFWTLLGLINIIYISCAVSTTKLNRLGEDNSHVFNINQLVNDIYPPKYAFLPDVDLRFHYGVDIFGAILTKITRCHPEISLDILTIIFLNLAFLVLYALALKFLNSNPINKYLVPFGAFLAWGPITNLFIKNPGEIIPEKFLEKVIYLAQNKLADAAGWSGLVLHWFFEPSIGIGLFFFLIGLYLTYRFFAYEENLKFVIMLGIFLSSLVIIDFSKLVILVIGILLHLVIAYKPQGEINKFKSETDLLKKLGILFLTVIVLGFIHGNCIRFDKSFIPFIEYYKLGESNLNEKFNLSKSNVILFLLFAIGFFQAFKQKINWTVFVLPYFIAALVIPYIVTIPNDGTGKILMSANVLGAFSLPVIVNFAVKQFNLKEITLTAFYSLFFIILSLSTILFWAFGDKTKPLLVLDGGSLKYTGTQVFTSAKIDKTKFQDELIFTNYLKIKKAKNQAIVTDLEYNDIFSTEAGLRSLIPPSNVYESPLKKQIVDQSYYDYRKSFLFDKKAWMDKKINWLYMTQKMLKYLMSPQSRKILLNAYLNNGVKLALSNKKIDHPENLKELYNIDPSQLSQISSENFPELLKKLLSTRQDLPYYIQQIADCPYYGIYNSKSNDFDGDNIADIAFYDPAKKSWNIIYGKDGHEDEIDLTSNILQHYKGSDIFIPMPADFDGDSKTDIALFNRTNSVWHVLNSSTSEVITQIWCGDWTEIPLPADLDGDSKSDFTCFNGNDGRWPALLSTTKGYHSNAFGTSPVNITFYSDLDGDKKSDYIIYKPLDGLYEIRLASCLGGERGGYCKGSDTIIVHAGSSNSRVVPADYDGDRKVDLATWTPESSVWEITYAKNFLSGEDTGAQKTIVFGKPGDIPMPGDYNGDGKEEIAIYHIDNSELEIAYDSGQSKKINLSKYKNQIPANFIGI